MKKHLVYFLSACKGYFILVGALLACLSSFAQLSTIHYLPPLYGSSANLIGDHSILITNPNDVPANISIRDGAGNTVDDGLGQVLANRVILPNSTTRMWLGNSRDAANILDRIQLNTVIRSEENLIIRSDVPVYVQVRHLYDIHGLMYSSKGDWALGNRFRAGTAFSRNGNSLVVGTERADFISVMAVNDNTTVEFLEFKPSINLINGGNANDFSVVLDENNSYTIASVPSVNDNMFLTGTLIVSDGPIIVNCGSWLIDNSDLFGIGERDMGADQIIPMNRLDTEYVLMNVDGSEFAEKILVVGDQDGTQYFINGSNTPSGNLNAGEFDIIDKDQFSINSNMHLESTAPIAVYQTTGLADFSAGFNIITPLKCWGTRSTVLPGIDQNFDLDLSKINIVARRNTTINISGGTLENPRPIPGTTEYETYRATPTIRTDIVITSDKNIQIGTSYRKEFMGAATYYSEYAQRDTFLFEQLCAGQSYSVGTSTYTESGTYQDTLTDINQCDSIVTLDLFVIPMDTTEVEEQICPGDSVLFQGDIYRQAGSYVQNVPTFSGCDSIFRLNLKFFDAATDTIYTTACQGESFNGFVLENDTFFVEQFPSIQNCDSTLTTFVSVYPEYENFLADTLCFGQSTEIGTQTVNVSGQYFDTLSTFQGCDSLIIIDLFIRPESADTNNITLCQGEFYNGTNYQVDTTITEISQDAFNCQLTTTTFISISESFETSQELTFCAGQSYNGILLNSDTTIVEDLSSQSGCDSTATSIITLDIFESLDTVYLNAGESYNGSTFEMDSLLTQDLFTAEGCDSTAMTQILINAILSSQQTIDLCPGETYENIAYFTDSTYTQNFTAANGFDSIVTYIIDVHEMYVDTFEQNICAGDSILFGGNFQSEAGFYSDPNSSIFGCDSTVILNLIVQDQISIDDEQSICEGDSLFLAGAFQTDAGMYKDSFMSSSGCDSIVNTNLVVNNIIEEVVEIPLCQNESYNGIFITQDTTIIETYTSLAGCDSLLSINLIFNTTYNLTDTIYVLENEGYENDTLITETLTSVAACDSIQNTQIIILPSISVQIEDDLCQGEFFNGFIINQDTTIVDTLSTFNGLDSFVIYNLTAHPIYTDTFQMQICPGDSILFASSYQSTEGFYSDQQNSIFGCDSVTVLELSVFDMVETTEMTMICLGDSLFVGGSFQSVDGTYVDVLQSSAGCDSMINTVLTVVESIASSEEINICQGEMYEGVLIEQDTVFTQSLMSSAGCDSIASTFVFVNPTYDLLDTTYVLEGQGYDMDTLFTEVLLSANGCDSLQTIQIIVLPFISTTLMEELCEGEFLNGILINQDTILIDTLTSTNGVDSFVITEVTTFPLTTGTELIDICEGEMYNGQIILVDTTFSSISQNVNGCDSLTNIELTVYASSSSSTTILLNEGEEYQGTIYASDTLLTSTLTSSLGCDSIVNVQLIILNDVFNIEVVDLCEGQAYDDMVFTSDTLLLDTLVSVSGADSINIIEINILDTMFIYEYFQACQGDTLYFGSLGLTSDETITEQILNDEGCFDTQVYVYSFNDSFLETETIQICEGQSISINGEDIFESGIYLDTLSASTGCDSIFSIDLLVSEAMTIQVEGVMPYCEDEQLILSVGDYQSYLWSDGSVNSNLQTNEAGTYEVTVTDLEGCVSIGTVNVPSPNIIEADLDINSPDCLEENFGNLEIITPLGTGENYSYTLLNNSQTQIEDYANLTPGFYTLEIIDDNGCVKIENFEIEAPFDLEVDIQGEAIIPLGDSTLLFATTNTDSLLNLQWSPSDDLSCDECLNPFASPTENTTFTLVVSTAEGCIDSTTYELRIDDNVAFYIPDVFSPNDDGINEYFYIHTNQSVEMIASLIIFDRWGNQVFINQNFLPNAELEGWNGKFRSKRMLPGVYVYATEILLKNGEVVFEKGDLLLLR